jgi:hypothetical protein
VFPDEMHLATLNNFLGACGQGPILQNSISAENFFG